MLPARLAVFAVLSMSFACTTTSTPAAQQQPPEGVREPGPSAVPAALAVETGTPLSDDEAVRQRFAAYCEAVLARDGKKALGLVDRRTIELYGEYLGLARTVDRAGLLRLDWMGKMVVLRIRHEFDAPAIAAMTGESLFVAGVEHGWISDASVRGMQVAQVTVNGASAGISLVQAPSVPVLHFIKEPPGWQLSLWKTFPLAEPLMQKMFVESGKQDPLEWIVSILEALSPRQFDRARLDGPAR